VIKNGFAVHFPGGVYTSQTLVQPHAELVLSFILFHHCVLLLT